MNLKLFSLLIFITLFFSCQKLERTNPFDSNTSPQLWMPKNFQATQEGNAVKLTWTSSNSNISGFRITKIYNNLSVRLNDLPNTATQIIDPDVVGGVNYSYYIVAFASNNESTQAVSNILPRLLASLITDTPSEISSNTAIVGGRVSANGGLPTSETGICYSTSPNPTTNNNKFAITAFSGVFSNKITGLASETTYYLRAYAINSQGTSYGAQVTFKTKVRINFNPNLTYGNTIDVEGNVYKTITIGSQTWMAENLKTTKYNDGTPIANITSQNTWDASTTGAYCWPNNDAILYKETYGALYNWYAVNSGKLCPPGWHIPSDAEWTTLIQYLGGESVGRDKLKESTGDHWLSPNAGVTLNTSTWNTSGFSAVPSGYRYGSFAPVGYLAIWWSSTEANQFDTICRRLDTQNVMPFNTFASRRNGFGVSVRCIKN